MTIFHGIAHFARYNWGMSGGALKTIYQGCVEPIISFGSCVWISEIDKVHFKRKVLSIQRAVLLRLTHSFRTTSNDALCVLAGVLPLDLKLKYEWERFKIKRNLPVSDFCANLFSDVYLERNCTVADFVPILVEGRGSLLLMRLLNFLTSSLLMVLRGPRVLAQPSLFGSIIVSKFPGNFDFLTPARVFKLNFLLLLRLWTGSSKARRIRVILFVLIIMQ